MSGGERGLGGLVPFLAVVLLYGATYSSVPTSDGYAWIAHIDKASHEAMLPAYHALPMYFLFTIKTRLTALGMPVETLALIQTVNAVLAALGAVLQYIVITMLGGGAFLGWVGGGLLAVSFGPLVRRERRSKLAQDAPA